MKLPNLAPVFAVFSLLIHPAAAGHPINKAEETRPERIAEFLRVADAAERGASLDEVKAQCDKTGPEGNQTLKNPDCENLAETIYRFQHRNDKKTPQNTAP